MRKGILQILLGALVSLSALPAVGQSCPDGVSPRIAEPNSSNVFSYAGAMRFMGQDFVENRGYTGSETAVALIDTKLPSWFLKPDQGPRPFGACLKPENAAPDHWGWAPVSDPAYPNQPCKIAWVMCVDADVGFDRPIRTGVGGSAAGIRVCTAPVEGVSEDTGAITSRTRGGHATNMAMGTLSAAPDAKIIAISIPSKNAMSVRAAMRWLYTKPADYLLQPGQADKVYLKASTQGKTKWKNYWTKRFGKRTPAQKFNIVVAVPGQNVSPFGFGKRCDAVNPAIPQIDTDKDGALDFADNCPATYNKKVTDVDASSRYVPAWTYPDSDDDGRGNACDGDLDNDNDSDWADVALFDSIRANPSGFTIPFDISKDGKIDAADRKIFVESADFDSDDSIDGSDRNFLVNSLRGKPLGPTMQESAAVYDDVRDPSKYLQDRFYDVGQYKRQSIAKYFSYGPEFRKLRKARVLPIAGSDNDGFTNGISFPACQANVLTVTGTEHHVDRFIADNYEKDTNTYVTRDEWGIKVNAAPFMSVLAVNGPGRNWAPLDSSARSYRPTEGCDVDPLNKGGYANSFTAPVTAGAAAVLRGPRLLPKAHPNVIQRMLMQTDRMGYVRRDCTNVLSPNRKGYDPELFDLYCAPTVNEAPWASKQVNYALPVLDLYDSVRAVRQFKGQFGGKLPDGDGDGRYDKFDNCKSTYNPNQRDMDADGYGDVCDADYDNDGYVDLADLSTFTSRFQGTDNPLGDMDGDGDADMDDYVYIQTNLLNKRPGPSGLDRDYDGVVNHLDNCVYMSNGPWTTYTTTSSLQRNQLDSDNDKFGDICDGDLNNNGVVDAEDEEIIRSKIRNQRYFAPADFNADQSLDFRDTQYFRDNLQKDGGKPDASGLCHFSNADIGPACAYN